LELARFADDDRVRIAAASPASGSAARNFLSLIRENAATDFDFVAFSDQDDLWDQHKLRRACQMLASSGSAGYSSATVARWGDGRERLVKISGAPTASDFLFEGAGQGCTFVLTADFYERVRRFVLIHRELTLCIHYHDWLVYALARSWGLRWYFDPQPSMRYRQHAENDTGARGTFKGMMKRLSRIQDGRYRMQIGLIARLCSKAAPLNPTINAWVTVLAQPACWSRRWRMATFCLRGGRRRMRDKLVVVFCIIAGWI
jgi:rhamnosyltransferase